MDAISKAAQQGSLMSREQISEWLTRDVKAISALLHVIIHDEAVHGQLVEAMFQKYLEMSGKTEEQ